MPQFDDAGLAHDIEEQRRLSLLAELGVLDTDAEPGFDALTRAAAAITQCPIALISLVDGERQWFKARIGFGEAQTPRAQSFCSYAIRTPDLMVVRDAQSDVRFAKHPLVQGSSGMRFYAGQPLTVAGLRIGTICVIDTQPRELGIEACEALQELGAAASAMLSERRNRVVSAEQQRRLTEFAMVGGDWLWETDARHCIVWMSCAYGNRPALPEPWVLGQPMDDGVLVQPRGDACADRNTLHGLFETKLGFARALVQSEIEGEQRYFSHSAVSRLDSSGRWIGYRGITRDSTARMAAELAHRMDAALLADLSAQVPGVIFQLRLDRSGRLSFPFVSIRVEDVCELSTDRLMANAKAALVRCHRSDARRVMQALRNSAARFSLLQETFRMVMPNAGERMLMVQAKPRAAEGGGVLWHGLLTDVTEQLVAAQHLRQMTLAQVASEKAVQVRGEFMSRVSHELRTPLNAILGFAQMLRFNGPSQPGVDILKSVLHIETAGAHLLALVNDMLDLASLEAGRLNLNLQPIALAPLVAHCITLIEPHARLHDITLEAQVEAQLPTVFADARATKQVLFNLLGNAVKFARPKSVVLVRVSQEESAAVVMLAITDSGPGIAPEKLSCLFEPFTRIPSSRSTPTGSGLGLSISQKLAWAMGGTIDVTSTPGHGTTFTVKLAVDGRPDVMKVDDSAFGDLHVQTTVAKMESATVLYIEDDPVNTLLMQALFESLPDARLQLIVAQDGAEGLREASRHQPNLILLDMHLPDADGLSILRSLRGDPQTAQIPVIAVSADALPEQIRNALEAGVAAYWTKPLNLKQVHSELVDRFRTGLVPASAG